MKIQRLSPWLLCLLGFSAGAAFAQVRTPGLWEYTVTMKAAEGSPEAAAMARMQQQMAAMSPEQRKQMEAMMGARGGGMGMGAGMAMATGQPTTVKACVTAEQAQHVEMPDQERRCKQTDVQRSGNRMKFKFECEGERQAKGEGEFEFDKGGKAYKGRFAMDTTVKGQVRHMEMEQSGRWLGADCGDVKPRTLPAQK